MEPPEDLNFPRQELSNGGLGIVIALVVRWQIVFLCGKLIGNPAVSDARRTEAESDHHGR